MPANTLILSTFSSDNVKSTLTLVTSPSSRIQSKGKLHREVWMPSEKHKEQDRRKTLKRKQKC